MRSKVRCASESQNEVRILKKWLRWLGIYLLVSMLMSLALSSWIRHTFQGPITYIGYQAPEAPGRLC